jgi:excisionase family DNA binding protein
VRIDPPKNQKKGAKMNDFEPITCKQAAKMIGISRLTWYRHNNAGKIPRPIKLGKLLLWNKNELQRWMFAGMPDRQSWEAIKKGCGE